MKTFRPHIFLFFIAILISPHISDAHKGGHSNKEVKKEILKSSADKEINIYLSKTNENPEDYYYYLKLGEAYIQKGREVGQIAPYKLAEKAIEKAIELYPESYVAYTYLGQISSYKHDFRKTINYTKKAIELRPDKAISYGVQGDAYLELGMYSEAQKVYALMNYLEPGFYSQSRISQLKFLMSDTDGAIEAMEEALEFGSKMNLTKENIAWAKVILGSLYFNSGKIDKAENSYKEALNIFDNYYLALEHLAEVNVIKGNYEKAINLYEKTLELNPKPQFYISLGDIYESQGKTEEAEKLYRQAEKSYEEIIQDGIKGHSRELVLFYVDSNKHLGLALDLALQDSKDTEDIYAYDTLAWVHFKRNDLDKAEDAITHSLKLGTKDALLYYHAGMILHKQNKFEEAKEHLELALTINPYFDKNKANESRTLIKDINTMLVTRK